MIIKEFEKQVEQYAHQPAVVGETSRLTYCQLNGEANRIARQIGAGDEGHIVALLFRHSPGMIAAVIGALKAGKTYVPLDINYPLSRLSYMLRHSGASLILTASAQLPLAEKLVETLDYKLEIIDIDAIDGGVSGENLQREPSGERLAYILYTSGSTGKPKGVVQNHENVLYYIRNWTRRFSITAADRMTLFSAFSHDGAGQDIFGALLNGAALYPYSILNRTNIARVSRWLTRERITIWHSVPTLYRYFVYTLTEGGAGGGGFPDLRFILLGGEPLRQHDLEMSREFFPHCRLANVYGQTESSVSSIWVVEPRDSFHRVLIGEPLDKTAIFLKDEDGEIVDDLGSGEIHISSPHLALGYWQDEENTARVFLPEKTGRVYRTGDLGRLLGDGTIEIMGRRDSQVKIRGFRVEAGEIETRLLKYQGIKEAVVVARAGTRPDDPYYLCAYLVPEPALKGPGPGPLFTVSGLRAYLAEELPEYMIPSYFISLRQMPLTPNGKVDRGALPGLEPQRPPLAVTFAAPQTRIEEKISRIWQEILGLDRVGIDDHFFELGGTSFDILKIMSALHRELNIDIPVVSLFRYPTVRSLAGYVQQEESGSAAALETMNWYARRASSQRETRATPLDIAVIGMAARFPGSRNIHEFWENLKTGVETIAFFNAGELETREIRRELLENPNYVKANGLLENIEYFDAAFFNYSPAEAEMMDPQLRLLHECSWEALEDAGYEPDSYEGLIGLYAGNAPNHYWVTLTYLNQQNPTDTLFLNNNYSTKVSYKLNLQGPSLVVQTACSTSLVALHMACRGLVAKECDIALAGGVSIGLPDRSGYLYQEGMILSPDGHCRAFDADAGGTVFGSGVGLVVLKRLDEALAQGDTIHAVIKATAMNNDGRRKVGVTAPSVEGQAEVIRAALQLAKLEPDSIGYVETHGTGTVLGDTVELEALKLAFNSGQRGCCGIGSVKTNTGHLNSAAGIAGFIKTVLVLKHGLIPPSLNFRTPNPGMDLENSPFYVNTVLREWKRGPYPRRAGVSSFGLGGTNAHAVLEESPQAVIGHGALVAAENKTDRQYRLVVLSAKTASALEQVSLNLADHFKRNPGTPLADAAFTLQVGRKAFRHRRAVVCADSEELVRALAAAAGKPQPVPAAVTDDRDRPVIFMFPGIGSQYADMGLELYRQWPEFRRHLDRCFQVLEKLTGEKLEPIMYPPGGTPDQRLDRPDISQLAVFSLEYALARLLLEWGLKPRAMIGYSFGEYTAACLSGVLSLEDALGLIAARGRFIMQTPEGKMIGVPLARAELQPLVDAFNAGVSSETPVSIAIDNGASCIAAGPVRVMAGFEQRMKARKYLCTTLPTSRAIHSGMLAPVAGAFAREVARVKLNPPQVPYISNLTGTWITAAQAADPAYWARHMTECVRFGEGLAQLAREPGALFLEVGPGRSLCSLVLRYIEADPGQKALNLIRPAGKEAADVYYLMSRLGQLWSNRVSIDWARFQAGEQRHRMPLPTYPFEGRYFWLKGNPLKIREERDSAGRAPAKRPDTAAWYYLPSWKRMELWGHSRPGAPPLSGRLIFSDESGLGLSLAQQLKQVHPREKIITVTAAPGFSRLHHDHYTVNPARSSDYDRLFQELRALAAVPRSVIHLWNVAAAADSRQGLEKDAVDRAQETGFYSLLYLVQAIGRHQVSRPVHIDVVTTDLHQVSGNERIFPGKATLLGPLKVIPQEYPGLTCRNIDIVLPPPGSREFDLLSGRLLQEISSPGPDTVVAYRDNHRWVQCFEPLALEPASGSGGAIKPGGVYWITGGLGGIGLTLAAYLAEHAKAKLILSGRSLLPPREEWTPWLERHGEDEAVSKKIIAVQRLEALGAEVMVCSADVAHQDRMQAVIAAAEQRFGTLNGVIHAAGALREKSSQCPLETLGPGEYREQLRPKVYGLLVLQRVLTGKSLDFCLLASSLASILGGLGLAAYAAVNLFMDAFAQRWGRDAHQPWISVNWDFWRLTREKEQKTGPLTPGAKVAALAMTPAEGLETFTTILSAGGTGQVAVSTADLQERLNRWIQLETLSTGGQGGEKQPQGTLHPRPELMTPYRPPRSHLEKELAGIWQTFFAVEQIGLDDDFFELGGDSLKAIAFTGKMQNRLNLDVPLSEFFNRSTIKELAAYIEGHTRPGPAYALEPVEKKEYYPMASAQKRLYILQRMEPESTAYNLTSAVVLEGETGAHRLENAIGKLILEHECLRTSFHMIGGEPVQRIHEEVEFKIEVEDLDTKEIVNINYKLQNTNDKQIPNSKFQITNKEVPFGQIDAFGKDKPLTKAREIGAGIKAFVRPFDLAKAPLLRVGLIKEAESRQVLVLDLHHTVYDGASIQLFFAEFMELYRGRALSGLRIQYKDYSQWQNRQRGSAAFQRQESYWVRVFSGEIPVLNLPMDFTRPKVQRTAGKQWQFVVEETETLGLKAVAREQSLTLFMVLLALTTILLMKLSGQEDIVVGTPVTARKHPDLEKIIGMLASTLALRNHPAPGKTTAEFLAGLKRTTLEAFDNQDYQFEDLVEKVNVRRDPGRNPLFDVMFIMHNYELADGGVPAVEVEGLKLKKYRFEAETSRFDLSFNGVELNNRLLFTIEYCTGLFKEETLRRFAGYFKKIAASFPGILEQKLSDIDIIPGDEKHRLLQVFNDTALEYARDKTIHRLFAEQVERTPDQVALAGKEEGWKWRSGEVEEEVVPRGQDLNARGELQISYRQLDAQAHGLAAGLQEKGVREDTIAAIMVGRGVEMIAGLLGILKAGAAYLPLDPAYPSERIDFMLKDSSAKLLVTAPGLSGKFEKLSMVDGQLLMVNEKPSANSRLHPPPWVNEPAPVAALAYVIYTSGSTGKPKGTAVRHGNAVNFITGMTSALDFSPGKSILALTTISFDIFFLETLLPVTRGMKVVIADESQQRDQRLLNRLMVAGGVEMVQFTPSRLQLYLSLGDDYRGLRAVSELLVGGEAFPAALLERVREEYAGKLYNVYGPTETTVWSALKDLSRAAAGEITLGTPLANTSIYIVDRWLQLQPLGVAGELLIGGEGVAAGYLNNPELTCERFINYKLQITNYNDQNDKQKNNEKLLRGVQGGGFLEKNPPGRRRQKVYRTGDLARWLTHGEIEFLGRSDHQVKLRGFRIELAEIEGRLSGHPGIREAVVLLNKSNGDTGTYLCAYIVGESAGELNGSKLRAYLAAQLPDYMIPSYFIRVERVPLTPNGKVDREALRRGEREGLRLKPGTAYVPPGTHREKAVARLWKEILKLDQVGLDDNFFELGGNSTHLLQLHAKLTETLALDIPVAVMFRYPTIKSFWRYLDNETPVDRVTDNDIDQSVSLIDETTKLWEDSLENR